MNKNIFRAYDIRGVYPEEVNEQLAFTIGQGFGTSVIKKGLNSCYVGFDNRLSSPSITENLIKGIISTGVNVYNCGLITTPMIYYIREYKKIYASMMVTASHNPGNENGFKFSFDSTGNVKGNDVLKFREMLISNNFAGGNGLCTKVNIKEDYISALLANIKIGNKKIKVVVDPGNGVTTSIIHDIMNRINADAIYICDENDGTFPNHHPDPCVKENLAMLQTKVKETNADLGIAFDGDGDRLGIVDNLGNVIPADIFSCLFIKDILNNKQNSSILFDNKCSKAVLEIINKYHGTPVESRTGASYTMASVKNDNHAFGVEYSGHIYFNDRGLLPISSGIYAGLRMIELLSNNDEPLSELLKEIPIYPKLDEMRIPTSDDIKNEIINRIIDDAKIKNLNYNCIDGIKILFEDSTVLIRASNTGPNLTFIVEANTKEKLAILVNDYLDLINKYNIINK